MGLNITEGSLEREDDYDFIDMADETPDFVIRSIPDGTTFPASRQKLTEASELFRDMFSCCDSDPSSKQSQVLELNESSETITLLLRLIDDSSSHYAFKPSPSDSDLTLPTIPSSVLIPLPLLRPLFALAEKYQLTPTIISSLQFHLSSHAPTDPLEVYSMATLHSIPSIAAQASGYLHSPPLHTYSKERIRMIPTAEAYHQLVVLHEHRISQLREHLKGEEMFPFGYGECPQHSAETRRLWTRKRNSLLTRVEAGTDIANEMGTIVGVMKECDVCGKAWIRAVEMLRYKCARVARTVDKLPDGVRLEI